MKQRNKGTSGHFCPGNFLMNNLKLSMKETQKLTKKKGFYIVYENVQNVQCMFSQSIDLVLRVSAGFAGCEFW